MIEYIYHDLLFATGYLPYGLVVGIPLAAVLMWAVNMAHETGTENRQRCCRLLSLGFILR